VYELEQAQSFEQFSVGDHAVFRRRFGLEDFAAFARASGDENPLHHDADFARRVGFAAPIVPLHMALAPLSRIAGMIFPGEPSLYLGHEVRAVEPIPYGAEVVYSARIVAIQAAHRVLTLRVLALLGSTVAIDATLRVQARAARWSASPAETIRPGAERGTAVITGATGAIGGAIARRLAREGYSLLLIGRDGDRLRTIRESLGRPVTEALRADLSTPVGRTHAADAVSRCGDVSLVVHAASPAIEAPVDEHVAVNFTALRGIAEAALPSLLARQSGAVIAIGSTAVERTIHGWEDYVAAKVAAASFTQSLERRFQPYGVRGLVLAFGFVRTPMSSRYLPAGEAALLPEEAAEALAEFATAPGRAPWRIVEVDGVRERSYEGTPVSAAAVGTAVTAREAALAGPAAADARAAPGDEVIAAAVQRSLNLPPSHALDGAGLGLTPGWDSLGHIALIVELEAALDVHFTSTELEKTVKYGDLLALCRRKLAERSTPPA
jgi:short-subunit dehydrogenase/acyl dehydratase/acyl carrier protein